MEMTFDILKKMVIELFSNDHSRIHSYGVTIEDLTMVLLLILVPKQECRRFKQKIHQVDKDKISEYLSI